MSEHLTEQSGRLKEYEGAETLVEAVGALLASPLVDLVVIRGFLAPEDARRLDADDPDRAAAVWQAVPHPAELTGLLAGWWERHGYVDFRFMGPGFEPGDRRTGSLVAHLDPGVGPYLYGPVSLSIVTSSTGGVFLAERACAPLRDAEGRFDPAAFDRLETSPDHPRLTGRRLRTAVEQGCGDAVLFTNHPTPAYHAVEAMAGREAFLFECVVEPR